MSLWFWQLFQQILLSMGTLTEEEKGKELFYNFCSYSMTYYIEFNKDNHYIKKKLRVGL